MIVILVWIGGGGGGIHYSLKNKPIIRLIKILDYSLKVRKVAKKSDYSLFVIFFFNSLKMGLFINFRPLLFAVHFLAHYSLFIIEKADYSLIIIPHPDTLLSYKHLWLYRFCKF